MASQETRDPRGDPRGRDAEKPSDIPAAGWKDVALRVKSEVQEDQTVLAASGVAFWGFLSLIPALAAFVSILGLVTSPEDAARRAEDLFGGLPSAAQDLLSDQLETIAGSTGSSLTTGLVVSIALALWTASAAVGHLISAVNVAYEEHDDRNFFVKKALALGLTLAAILFLAFAVVGLAALPSILDATGLPGPWRTALQFAYWPVLALGFMTGLAVLYRVAPDRSSPRWKWVSWGAGAAVVLWIVASVAFRIYTANFASYNETYGSLAAVVVLMLWLLITALAVLIGAEINSEIEHQTAVDSTVDPDRPMGDRNAVVADTLGEAAGRSDRGAGPAAGGATGIGGRSEAAGDRGRSTR
jgi:membrane protein